jgi:hypothetical protein
MNHALVDSIVKAVLYEGYMLYPYRPSAVKNRQRFNFGVVYPRPYSNANHVLDACTMQTECLIVGNAETQCIVRVRFLRMIARTIAKPNVVSDDLSTVLHHGIEIVPRLTLPDRTYQPWQEAVEETIEVTEFDLPSLARDSMQWPFRLSAKHDQEPILDHHANIVGFILRDKRAVVGTIEFSAQALTPDLFKLKVLISNDSPFDPSKTTDREQALERSLVSAHTILSVRNGEFVSLVDPPDSFRDAAHSCQNVGTWPILVGAPGERDTMLSSPIILYDYPEIAPESPGDLFDGAEIDEILSLRIMTMTDEEKREMRESDERARQILERTESLPEEQWMKLHGALRGLRAARGETS